MLKYLCITLIKHPKKVMSMTVKFCNEKLPSCMIIRPVSNHLFMFVCRTVNKVSISNTPLGPDIFAYLIIFYYQPGLSQSIRRSVAVAKYNND